MPDPTITLPSSEIPFAFVSNQPLSTSPYDFAKNCCRFCVPCSEVQMNAGNSCNGPFGDVAPTIVDPSAETSDGKIPHPPAEFGNSTMPVAAVQRQPRPLVCPTTVLPSADTAAA